MRSSRWSARSSAGIPTCTFELDETNDQRAWPFESAAARADRGSTTATCTARRKTAKLLHDLWTRAPWLPTSLDRLRLPRRDARGGPARRRLPAADRAAEPHHLLDRPGADPAADQPEVTAWLHWYRAHRATLAGAAYELTDHDPLDGTSWAAFEPWNGGRGALFAFRQAGGDSTQTFALHGVRPDRDYLLTDARTGEVVARRSGAQLRAGLTVTLPDANSAQVLQIDPVSG